MLPLGFLPVGRFLLVHGGLDLLVTNKVRQSEWCHLVNCGLVNLTDGVLGVALISKDRP